MPLFYILIGLVIGFVGHTATRDRTKTIAILLAVFFWGTGSHKLYLGQRKGALTMAGVSFGGVLVGSILASLITPISGILETVMYVPMLAMCLVSLIEAFSYFRLSKDEFTKVYVLEGKEWF